MGQYGALFAVIDFSGVDEGEFSEWYDTEHIPERIATPGFLTATRWVAADGRKLSLGLYDLEDVAVLKGEAYRSIAGPNLSPWSKRLLRQATSSARYEAVQLLPGDRLGTDETEFVYLIRHNIDEAVEDDYHRWYDEEHLPGLASVPGVHLARRFRAENDAKHRYLATYHLESAEIPQTPEWRKVADTTWSDRVRQHMSDRDYVMFKRPA